MRRNDEAAVLAAIAGGLLLLVGYSGARGVHRFVSLLFGFLGDRPLLLLVLAYVLVAIASLGGIAVLLGAYLIHADRVRTGRLLILLGSGAGLISLILFLVGILRREAFDLLLEVLPALLGVSLGIVARFRAKATPIL
ncbi:MAG: hypothetical protein ACT4OI_05745 [Methanobacteriota archaeon]